MWKKEIGYSLIVCWKNIVVFKLSRFFRHIVVESQRSSRQPSHRRYYRALSDHMEFGLGNSPVQEIANDLNVGAAHWDRKSPWPQLWWMDLGLLYNLKAFYVCPNTYSLNDPPYVPIVVQRNHEPVNGRDSLLSRFESRELLAKNKL